MASFEECAGIKKDGPRLSVFPVIYTAELIAIESAAALRCEHCLEAHMQRALAEGATLDEIMDTLLIAGAIADSSTLSVAFRKYKQLEGKTKRTDACAGGGE